MYVRNDSYCEIGDKSSVFQGKMINNLNKLKINSVGHGQINTCRNDMLTTFNDVFLKHKNGKTTENVL